MAVFGSLFLGLGKGDPIYPLAMLFVASTSFFFTDWLGFGLGRPVAGSATLAFLVYSFTNIAGREDQNRLETITNLLIFLQVMLLYLEKRDSIYWLLVVLSLLEVVVAAAMNIGVEFGIMLVLFLMLTFYTLTLFYVVRETRPATAAGRSAKKPPATGEPLPAAWTSPPEISVAPLTIPLLNRVFLGQIAVFCGVIVAFSVFAFYTMRRVPTLGWNQTRGARQSLVGFAPTVSLDEMGQVLQSNDVAMRVAFEDARTGAPYLLNEEPYFRGLVLSRYGQRDISGTWLPNETHSLMRVPSSTSISNVVIQEIWLAPTADNTLFSLFPVASVADTPQGLFLDPHNGRLMRLSRDSSAPGQPYHYRIGTTGLRAGRSLPIVPGPRPTDDIRAQQYQERFPHLSQLAEQIIRDGRIEGWDWYRQAKLLESHFLAPGQYKYTLDFRFERDETIDPIEDFIANHKQGHCEYFASALALMLRSLGIPSRLVVGYHGGEYNPLGHYFQVRQSDAHAWVEAYMRPQDLVAMGIDNPSEYPTGGWLRLDPTPSTSAMIVQDDQETFLDSISSMFDYAQFLWNDYVLGFHTQPPRRATSDPTSDDLIDFMLPPMNYDAIVSSLKQSWRASDQSLMALLWRVLVLLLVIAVLGWLAYRVFAAWCLRNPAAAQALRKWFQRFSWQSRVSRRGTVEFYERFESLLAKCGHRRGESQTPWEFFERIRDSFASRAPQLIEPCRQVVQAFYQVRFGQTALNTDQSQAIERHLAELRTLLESSTHPTARETA
ncbi:MAG: Protein-glutamine gamma-glutamyltransferase [Planctomycetota bacterium]